MKTIINLIKKLVQIPIVAFILTASLALFGLWLLFAGVVIVITAFSGEIYDRTIWMTLMQVFLVVLPIAYLYREYRKVTKKRFVELSINQFIREQFDSQKSIEEINLIIENVNTRVKQLRVNTYKLIYSGVAFSYFLFAINAFTGIIPGWINLSIIGLLLILAYYKYSTLDLNVKEIEATAYPKDENQVLKNLQQGRLGSLKVVRTSLVLLLLINGNWLFQLNKNENDRRNTLAAEFQDLIGQGWCENNEVESDGAGGYFTYGGWPCITIGRITNVKFNGSGTKQSVCATVWFNRENGGPDDDSYILDFASSDFCSPKIFGDYSTSTLEDEMYEFISPKLKELKTSLCNYYYYRMNQDDQLNFCYY